MANLNYHSIKEFEQLGTYKIEIVVPEVFENLYNYINQNLLRTPRINHLSLAFMLDRHKGEEFRYGSIVNKCSIINKISEIIWKREVESQNGLTIGGHTWLNPKEQIPKLGLKQEKEFLQWTKNNVNGLLDKYKSTRSTQESLKNRYQLSKSDLENYRNIPNSQYFIDNIKQTLVEIEEELKESNQEISYLETKSLEEILLEMIKPKVIRKKDSTVFEAFDYLRLAKRAFVNYTELALTITEKIPLEILGYAENHIEFNSRRRDRVLEHYKKYEPRNPLFGKTITSMSDEDVVILTAYQANKDLEREIKSKEIEKRMLEKSMNSCQIIPCVQGESYSYHRLHHGGRKRDLSQQDGDFS
ncbi:MAG: hypothetical protein AABX61_01260 [Nanoarchaeota archaeon]